MWKSILVATMSGLLAAGLTGLGVHLALNFFVGEQTSAAEAASAFSQSTPEYRGEALADGKVTANEYNAAALEYADCGEDAGFTPVVIGGEGLRVTRVGFKLNSEGDASTEFVATSRSILEQCYSAHLSEIASAWSSQLPLPDAATLKGLIDRLDRCMADSAQVADVPPVVSGRYLEYEQIAEPVAIAPEHLNQYAACSLQLEAETGFIAPAPRVVAK